MGATVRVQVSVNGERRDSEVEARTLLVHWLRDGLGLTGTHIGCDTSNCGACTVHLNGEVGQELHRFLPHRPTAARSSRSRASVTADDLHPLQEAFCEQHGLQCGFCTPGMIMAAADLLERNPGPDDAQVRHALEGNLCRCTGYHNIVKAVLAVAGGSTDRAGEEVAKGVGV